MPNDAKDAPYLPHFTKEEYSPSDPKAEAEYQALLGSLSNQPSKKGRETRKLDYTLRGSYVQQREERKPRD